MGKGSVFTSFGWLMITMLPLSANFCVGAEINRDLYDEAVAQQNLPASDLQFSASLRRQVTRAVALAFKKALNQVTSKDLMSAEFLRSMINTGRSGIVHGFRLVMMHQGLPTGLSENELALLFRAPDHPAFSRVAALDLPAEAHLQLNELPAVYFVVDLIRTFNYGPLKDSLTDLREAIDRHLGTASLTFDAKRELIELRKLADADGPTREECRQFLSTIPRQWAIEELVRLLALDQFPDGKIK